MTKEKALAPLARFPPLARIPAPPRFPPDPRQKRTQKILGGIARVVESEMMIAGPNLVQGFPASGVDLGRLKSALERGIKHFDIRQLQERWDEVHAWMCRAIGTWVQRHKRLKIELADSGIRVEIKTQDDHGYYVYAFDVFPGR
jgi:hypothetical protein